MADHGANAVEELPKAADSHDILSLLSSPDRDYLVRNSGDQVKIDGLKGKKVGLYFSASWCGPCHRFTPKLVDVYNGVSAKGEFEIVFISADEDDESFNEYFSKMPWLAVPFSDSTTRDSLDSLFKVLGIPNLVLLDETGKVLTDGGVEIILEHGVEGYPFTPDRLKELKEQEEAARRDQSLRSILVSQSRDYAISADGKKVPITELEGKTVGLYFSLSSYNPCAIFSEKLIKVYENLKEKGERFEIVSIPLDDEDEESFKQGFEGVPWLSLPFKDNSCKKLVRYFELSGLPTLVILGPDGKTLHPNVAAAIEEHGSLAYPFTPMKLSELEEMEKAKQEKQTLESILVSGDQNFVIGKDGCKGAAQVARITDVNSVHGLAKSSCEESMASTALKDIHMPARLMENFLELARDNTSKDLETCGILGASLKEGTFYITTLIIPKQESTSSSCQALNEEEIFAIQNELSHFPVGWIHTHPSQSCFMSSVDLHTQYSYQVMVPEAVAIVMAPTDKSRDYGVFRLSDPGGMTILKECPERGFHTHRELPDGSSIYEHCTNVYINPYVRLEICDLR